MERGSAPRKAHRCSAAAYSHRDRASETPAYCPPPRQKAGDILLRRLLLSGLSKSFPRLVRCLAPASSSCGRYVAAESAARFDHLVRHLRMALCPRELVNRLALPVEAQPFEPVDERGNRGFGRAGAVGVLDAQQELAAGVLGVKPVEQRGARAADVQIAGGGRGKACYHARGGRHRDAFVEAGFGLRARANTGVAPLTLSLSLWERARLNIAQSGQPVPSPRGRRTG